MSTTPAGTNSQPTTEVITNKLSPDWEQFVYLGRSSYVASAILSDRTYFRNHPAASFSAATVNIVRVAGCMAAGIPCCAATRLLQPLVKPGQETISESDTSVGDTDNPNQIRMQLIEAINYSYKTWVPTPSPCADCKIRARVTVEAISDVVSGDTAAVSHKEISKASNGFQALGNEKLDILIRAAFSRNWLSRAESIYILTMLREHILITKLSGVWYKRMMRWARNNETLEEFFDFKERLYEVTSEDINITLHAQQQSKSMPNDGATTAPSLRQTNGLYPHAGLPIHLSLNLTHPVTSIRTNYDEYAVRAGEQRKLVDELLDREINEAATGILNHKSTVGSPSSQ